MPTKKELEEQVKQLKEELEKAKSNLKVETEETEIKELAKEVLPTDQLNEIEAELCDFLKEIKGFTDEYPVTSIVASGLLGLFVGCLVSK